MSHTTPIDPDLNQDFSINKLLSAINDTKNTTPGPDNICYEMFQHTSIKSLEVMLQLSSNRRGFRSRLYGFWVCSGSVQVQVASRGLPLPQPTSLPLELYLQYFFIVFIFFALW